MRIKTSDGKETTLQNVSLHSNINEFRSRISPHDSIPKNSIEIFHQFKHDRERSTVNTTSELRLALKESVSLKVAEFSVELNSTLTRA